MKYTHIKDLKISKITLGTAQIGMKYGIANISGKPSLKVAYEILQLAIDSGINCFDTAPVYKDSEDIIGSFFNKKKEIPEFPIIITKLPYIPEKETYQTDKIRELVQQNIYSSLKRLKIDKIPIYLLHSSFNLCSHHGKILESLLAAKECDLIKHIGVSVYNTDEVLKSLEFDEIEVIQAPVNIFDQRIIKEGLLEKLKDRNVITLARSVFLQGLFFLDPYKLPIKFLKAKESLLKLQNLSRRENISIGQLVFNYIRDLPGITSIIVGVEKIDQLVEDIKLLSTPPLSSQLNHEIYNSFNDIPYNIFDPRKWND